MIENVKSVLIGLTKAFGPEEVSSALGYGHSRLRELIFGDVTQSLLKQSSVPLFMAY
jgi:hypothetical protein